MRHRIFAHCRYDVANSSNALHDRRTCATFVSETTLAATGDGIHAITNLNAMKDFWRTVADAGDFEALFMTIGQRNVSMDSRLVSRSVIDSNNMWLPDKKRDAGRQ